MFHVISVVACKLTKFEYSECPFHSLLYMNSIINDQYIILTGIYKAWFESEFELLMSVVTI